MREREATGQADRGLDRDPLSRVAERPIQVPHVLGDVVLGDADALREVARRRFAGEQRLAQTLAHRGIPGIGTGCRATGHADANVDDGRRRRRVLPQWLRGRQGASMGSQSRGCRRGPRARPPAAPLALALALCLGAFGCSRDAPRTSILLVSLDTLRRDHVGAYGDGRSLTPALDALAAEGLVYEAAFTTMPTTGPAHVSLFTGRLPGEHGVLRNGDALSPEAARHTAIADLQRAGFATAAFVTTRWMSQGVTGLEGFDVYDAPSGSTRPGKQAVERALAWLDQPARRPVFLFVHIYDAHAPYGNVADKQYGMRGGLYGWIDPRRYPSAAAHRRMAERYARGVREADEALGALVEGVRARLVTPPLVVVTADHGEALDEHVRERGYAYDHGEFLDLEAVQIPLVLTGPGVGPGRSRGAVSIRDLADTLRLAGGIAVAGAARDLRVADDRRRVVTMQRRRYLGEVRPSMRSHVAAASDGEQLVIVGEDGLPSGSTADAAPDLLAAARGVPRPDGALSPLDPDLAEALESLGYAE